MTIGAAAVMGPTGIVAAAPFVAAKGVLMPVVAPVIRFTTVSSLMIGARLDRVQKALGRLFEVVEGMRRPMEAEEYDLARLKLSRVLGRGRALAARTRNVRNIRKDFNSIRARMKSWTDAFESAIDESREPSILFYREPDGEQECACITHATCDCKKSDRGNIEFQPYRPTAAPRLDQSAPALASS